MFSIKKKKIDLNKKNLIFLQPWFSHIPLCFHASPPNFPCLFDPRVLPNQNIMHPLDQFIKWEGTYFYVYSPPIVQILINFIICIYLSIYVFMYGGPVSTD